MHWLENWILPPRCVISGEKGVDVDLSATVIQSFKKPHTVCPQCCEFSADGEICGTCLASPPAYDRTQVGYFFSGDLVTLVHELKYSKQIAYARLLAELLVEQVELGEVQALLAVPIHDKRWRCRGFNQAQLLAESLAKTLQIPVINNAVFRVKDTPSQTGLTAAKRAKNLQGAFALKPQAFEGYEHIALIDDVITTSATMSRLATMLKQQTALQTVEAWAIAKTQ